MQKVRNASLAAIVIIAPALTWAQSTSGGNTRSVSGDHVAFYEVPLTCPAARNLDCRSAAKPVLAALEKRETIEET
jgi:hypothetical protein